VRGPAISHIIGPVVKAFKNNVSVGFRELNRWQKAKSRTETRPKLATPYLIVDHALCTRTKPYVMEIHTYVSKCFAHVLRVHM